MFTESRKPSISLVDDTKSLRSRRNMAMKSKGYCYHILIKKCLISATQSTLHIKWSVSPILLMKPVSGALLILICKLWNVCMCQKVRERVRVCLYVLPRKKAEESSVFKTRPSVSWYDLGCSHFQISSCHGPWFRHIFPVP